MLTQRVVSASLLILWSSRLTAQPDQCRDVLVAAYNRLDLRQNASSSAAARSWFCSDQFFSDVSRHAAGGSLTVPIEGIPLSFGGNSQTQRATEARLQFCRSSNQAFTNQDALSIFSQVVEKETIRAWQDCMRGRNDAGSAIALSESVNGSEIIVTARFDLRINSQVAAPRVVDIFVSGARPVRGQWLPSAEVTPGGIVHVFRRTSDEMPVSITLATTQGSSAPLQIAARELPVLVGEIEVEWEESYTAEGTPETVWRQLQTGDHNCESNCGGEPTRTTYQLVLQVNSDASGVLRNARLDCLSGPCGGWNQKNRVEITGRTSAYASWDVWSHPTVWRLSADWVPAITRWRRGGIARQPLRRGDVVVVRRPRNSRGVRIFGRTLEGGFDFPHTSIRSSRWLRFVSARWVGDTEEIRFEIPRR
jgi:hypothetical protein